MCVADAVRRCIRMTGWIVYLDISFRWGIRCVATAHGQDVTHKKPQSRQLRKIPQGVTKQNNHCTKWDDSQLSVPTSSEHGIHEAPPVAVKISNPTRSPSTGRVRDSTSDGGQSGLTGGDETLEEGRRETKLRDRNTAESHGACS